MPPPLDSTFLTCNNLTMKPEPDPTDVSPAVLRSQKAVWVTPDFTRLKAEKTAGGDGDDDEGSDDKTS